MKKDQAAKQFDESILAIITTIISGEGHKEMSSSKHKRCMYVSLGQIE